MYMPASDTLQNYWLLPWYTQLWSTPCE